MATAAVLVRLQQRANQADKIIAQLKVQLEGIKKTAVANACRAEEASLSQQNAALRAEVDRLKSRLIQAETRNGVEQVLVPIRSEVAMATAVPPAAVASQQASKQAEQASKQEKKKDKKGDTQDKKAKQPAAPADDKPIDVSRLKMLIGRIVNAKKHPDADSLYVEEVDVGEEKTRTVVSGLVAHVPLEQMQNRVAVFMCNLKPAKMRGILSEAMIMCGSSPEKVEILVPPEGAQIGERVSVPGFPGDPDPVLNPKKKIWEQIQPDLRVDGAGLATYKSVAWTVADRGPCKAPTMRDSAIK